VRKKTDNLVKHVRGLRLRLPRCHSGPATSTSTMPRSLYDEMETRQMCFVRESELRRLNRIPRRGSDQGFLDPVTGLPNDNVHEPLEKFDGSKTCFVFISHLWLRPGAGPDAHPDNVDHQMCKLILSAFDRLRGPHSSPVPEDIEFAVYIDFSCLDQDTAVTCTTLGTIECIVPGPVTLAIQQCDLFLIPVVDPDYLKWSRPMMVAAENGQDSSINPLKNGQLEAFEPAGWQDYLERAWCRWEMMQAAAYPVNNCEERASLFRGSMQTALSNGLRPSAMCTDWFMVQEGKSAEFLPPLKHDFFERYPPEDGKLFTEENRSLLREITRRTREEWSLITSGLLLNHTGPTAVDRAGGGGGGGVKVPIIMVKSHTHLRSRLQTRSELVPEN
jgi:hypothetical protein